MLKKETTNDKDLFNLLENYLAFVVSKLPHFNGRNAHFITMLDSVNFDCKETDGNVYNAEALLLVAFDKCEMGYPGVSVVVYATPFNCYFGEGNYDSIKSKKEMSKVRFQTDENLTAFYRQQMKESLGDEYAIKLNKYLKDAQANDQEMIDDETIEPEIENI